MDIDAVPAGAEVGYLDRGADESATLLRTCEELLELLRAHQEHARLRGLIEAVEALCDRIHVRSPR